MSPNFRAGGIAPARFTIAVHILVWLAGTEGVCPSAEIASQVQGHATFLRRVLAPLVQAGIVEAREGRVGGYSLAKPAEKISLGDVYVALKNASPSEPEPVPGESECGSRGEQLDLMLNEILRQAEERAVGFLSDITIADLARKIGA